MGPIYDAASRSELQPTKFAQGNWVTKLIAQESAFNSTTKIQCDEYSDDDDSETENSYFHKSAYHKYFRKKQVKEQV